MNVDVGDATDPISPALRAAVDARIEAFLASQESVLAEMGPGLAPVRALVEATLAGGKRLRPAFCVWGYVAATGAVSVPTPVIDAAASLELLHVSALVHDDVMDGSDLRRGQPAAHRWLEGRHRDGGGLGDAEAFGRAGAILLGDLLLMWSVEMLARSGISPDRLAAAQRIAEVMRTEVTGGQFLDVAAQARPLAGADLERSMAEAHRVVEFKSARYTVQRPCQLGAAIGGDDAQLQAALAAYGSPLGRSFQFRDDILGVFGDPAVTGKPAGDDLREGKRTVLVAYAYAHADSAGRRLLTDLLGNPDLDEAGVFALQELMISVGARQAVEALIGDGYARALSALDDASISATGRVALTRLASLAAHRAA